MDLAPCRVCGYVVQRGTVECPECGQSRPFPLPRWSAPAVLAVLVTILFAVVYFTA